MPTKHSVAILGGGVGGLSAAHELAERGFAVTVYERNAVFGGKARSLIVAGSGVRGIVLGYVTLVLASAFVQQTMFVVVSFAHSPTSTLVLAGLVTVHGSQHALR